mmetsp:Transcript_32328/g.44410  ORF Transcript_32328/g.44410 Transcript_32328/m.44410 type:complete len:107 (+) Transcript_32328:31-351(+)
MQRARALTLYKNLLRESRKVPYPNREKWLIMKTRKGFRENQTLVDCAEIDFELRLGETHLDSIIHIRRGMMRMQGEEQITRLDLIKEEDKTSIDVFGEHDTRDTPS